MMQRILILALAAGTALVGQTETKQVFVAGGGVGAGIGKVNATPVLGEPYSATVTNESVQTLADGNRIVQSSAGTIARDSMGRTRQDAPLPPAIGNLAPADMPHFVIITDPVAQVSYTLNVTDKTATKNPGFGRFATLSAVRAGAAVQVADGPVVSIRAAGPLPPQAVTIQKDLVPEEGEEQTEDIGSKTLEGVVATGTRTTRTIPAGKIGNDRPISIVTEVWTSPELKTVIYSKRSDPRVGDQTFQLTNIVRAEPDPTLFTVPSDFKLQDAFGPVVYKTSGGAQ